MARSVTFNGITRFTPGGITRINAAALAQVTLGDNSIVGLIGEADGGAPGDTGGLVTFFDPSRAADVYKSGPIVDALNLAFQASNDPDVPGGASRVYVWKTNNSTQSTLSLPGQPVEVLVSDVASGDGTTTTIVDADLNTQYGYDVDDELIGYSVIFKPFTADAAVVSVTDYVASSGTLTVGTIAASFTNDPYLLVKNSSERLAIATGGTVSTIVDSTATYTVDELIGRWVILQNSTGVSYLRQISDNDATTLILSEPMGAAPATGAYFQILPEALALTSADWGAHTTGITVDIASGTADRTSVVTVEFEDEEEVSPDLGGKILFKVLYKGDAATVDTVAASSTTTLVNLTTGGLTPDAEIGKQVLVNGEYTVITDNDAGSLTVSPALSVAPPAASEVEITPLTGGYLEIKGSAGVATGLETKLFGVAGQGYTTGELEEIVFTNNMTLRQLLAEINKTTAYEAVAGAGVNQDTTLVKDLDFGPQTRTSSSALQTSASLFTNTTGEGGTRDLMAVVDYFNDFSTFVNAARPSTTGNSVAGSIAPFSTTTAQSMSGGTRGASANADFQGGFDELLKLRVNSVVPLIDEDLTNEGFGSTATIASVAAQAAAHCAVARGAAQDTAGERGAFVGFQGTKAEIIQQANDLNDQDVALVCQNPTTLDRTGTLVEFGPRMLAVIGASMRAGVQEVAEPLTHKLLRVSGLTQDSSWDPSDITDANELIINGVLFAEAIDGLGTRWVRDLTTWVADDNLAFSEGSVRDAVRFVAYGLRTTLVERFTGKKATPATIGNVKDAAATYLELTRQDNIIVDSTDPATGEFVKAYHNLKVTSSGDTVSINVGIFPVPGINFQLTDIFLQLPTQSA